MRNSSTYVRHFCAENMVDISMFATEGKSIVSTEDSRVVDAIEFLLESGFTQAAVASALHLSATFVCKVSTGEYKKKPFSTGRVLDKGKIKALFKAGWEPNKIADDMQVPIQSVVDYLVSEKYLNV